MPADLHSEHFSMQPPDSFAPNSATRANSFTSADIERILRARGWLGGELSPEVQRWLTDAATLLGPQALEHSASPSDAASALTGLLELIFAYDARAILSNSENQAVMSREGAREVIRELANRVLASGQIDSEHFKEIIEGMKSALGFTGRKLFHPLRLALAGRAGEGDLDRVILLLDAAARLSFGVQVKGTRQRMIDFCAALD